MKSIKLFKINIKIVSIYVCVLGLFTYNTSSNANKNQVKIKQKHNIVTHKVNVNTNSTVPNINLNDTSSVMYQILSNEFIGVNKRSETADYYIKLSNHFKNPALAERSSQLYIDSNKLEEAKKSALLWEKYIKEEDKFNLYRTLSYISANLKEYSKLSDYVKLWLSSIPESKKDTLISELNKVPDLISISDPVVINDIADIILSYKLVDAKLVAAKMLIKAKQNRGLEIINALKKDSPNNEEVFFTWLGTISAGQQIIELKNYIEQAKQNKNEQNTIADNIEKLKYNTEEKSNDDKKSEFNLKRANFALLANLFIISDFKAGIEYGRQIIDESPQDLECAFLLAQFYRVQKEYDKSYEVMTNLLEHHRRVPIPMYIFLSDISKEKKDYKLAAYWLEQSEVKDIRIFKDIASLYMQIADYENAHKYYNKIRDNLEQTPENLQKFDMLAIKLWLSVKQWNHALKIIDRLYISNKSIELLSLRSDIYLVMNNFDKAEADLEVMVKADINNINALNSLAYIYAQKSIKLDIAAEYAQKALDKDSENYAYQDTMGWVLYKQGKLAQAKKWLEKSWNTQPDIETGKHLAQVLVDLGEADQAKIILALTKKINPNDANLENETTASQKEIEKNENTIEPKNNK